MVVAGTDKLLCDLHWGSCAYYDLAADPREQRTWPRRGPSARPRCARILDEWLDGHVRFEPLLAKGASNPKGGPLPQGDRARAPGRSAGRARAGRDR